MAGIGWRHARNLKDPAINQSGQGAAFQTGLQKLVQGQDSVTKAGQQGFRPRVNAVGRDVWHTAGKAGVMFARRSCAQLFVERGVNGLGCFGCDQRHGQHATRAQGDTAA